MPYASTSFPALKKVTTPVLVSFDIALRDIELLWDLALSVVIVDEAHKLKNRHSKITQALHRFDCVSRFGLSGTIIQNKYEEMYTTLDWTNPGRLGESKDWKGYIVKPLTAGQSSGATEAERATAHVCHIFSFMSARRNSPALTECCVDFTAQDTA